MACLCTSKNLWILNGIVNMLKIDAGQSYWITAISTGLFFKFFEQYFTKVVQLYWFDFLVKYEKT